MVCVCLLVCFKQRTTYGMRIGDWSSDVCSSDLIERAQALADAAAEGEVCTVANDNDPAQVVISGHRAAIERAVALVKDHGIKRGVLLPVSAPFHCPLMQAAADAMAEALDEIGRAHV